MDTIFIFLKKYAGRIILFCALVFLALYLNPLLEEDYLRIDLHKLESLARITSIALIALLFAVVLFFFTRHFKGWKQFFTSIISLTCYGIAFFFLLNPFVYGALLFVNKMQHKRIDKKYIVRVLNADSSVWAIYDIEQQKPIYTDQLKGLEVTKRVLWGDTMVISFYKGLLGINYQPLAIKTILARPKNVPPTAFRIKDKDSIYWYDVMQIHDHKNNAYINIYSDKTGRLVLGKRFNVICQVVDTLKPVWIDNLQEQIIGFDGKNILLKREEGKDTCWMQ